MEGVTETLAEIPISSIFADPQNNYCRRGVNYTSVSDLAASIKEAGMLINPICVTPFNAAGYSYRLVSGFRRFTACKFLKWENISAKICEGMTEEQIAYVNFSENLDRKNPNILEEAYGIRHFVSIGYKATQISKKIHKSNMWVTVRMALLSLPEEVQQRAAAGVFKQEEILSLSKHYKKVIAGTMTQEDFDSMVAESLDYRLRAEKKNAVAATKVFQAEHNSAPAKKSSRTKEEIGEMQGLLISLLGNNLASRAIAWASCGLTGKQFLEIIKKEAELYDIKFNIPQVYLDDPTR